MSLFDTIMFLISKGKTENLLNKVEIFYNNDKLTKEEYDIIINFLNQ